ncbi:MAG: tetratricopeptide repeat protein [Ferruginibacter sp.]
MSRQIICLAITLLILGSSIAQTAGPAKTATEYYNEGVKLKDNKEYADAIVSFKKAITAKPNYREALFEAGWCSNEISKYNDALSFLLKAKQQWPDEPKVYFEIGYANQQLSKPEEAKTNYKRCLALKKDYGLAYKYLGNLFYGQSDYSKALENYTSYTGYESDIDSDDFYYKKGYCENELEKYSDAVESLARSIELNAEEAPSFDELGYAYYKLENADDAIKNYNRSIALKSTSHVPYLGLGDVYKDLKKNSDDALSNYLKAAVYKAESKKAQYSIGWCYNDKSNYNDAIPYLKKALSIDSKYVSALTELGYSYYALAKYEDALDEFNKAIAISKTSLSVYYSGLCYVGMKNKAAALKKYEDLVALESSYADKLKTQIDGMP